MRIDYNDQEWDITDKQEVDLVNAAIEVSLTPIHAFDAIYDAGRKLMRELEQEAEDGNYYEVHTEKMEYIVKNFKSLADSIESLRYIESQEILAHNVRSNR